MYYKNLGSNPTASKLSSKGLLLAVLLIILVVRLFVMLPFQDIPNFSDEWHYLLMAKLVADDLRAATKADNWHQALFKIFYRNGDSLRAPLAHYFMGINGLLGGDNFRLYIRLSQILISVITGWILYSIGRLIFEPLTALFCGLIFAFYPDYIFYTSYFMSEVLFTALLWAGLLFLLIFDKKKQIGFLCLAGFLLGLAALCRSLIVYFVPFLVLWLFLFNPQNFWKNLRNSIIFVASIMIVIIPWTIRNYFIHHQFVLIDTFSGPNLYIGNDSDQIVVLHGNQFLQPKFQLGNFKQHLVYLIELPEFSNLDEVNLCKMTSNAALEKIFSDLPLFLERCIWKVSLLMGLEDEVLARFILGHYGSMGILSLWIITLLIWGAFIVVTLTGVAGLIFAPKYRYKTLFIFLIVFYITLHAVVFAKPRYHYPIMPVFFLYAGWVISTIIKMSQRSKELVFQNFAEQKNYSKYKTKLGWGIFFLMAFIFLFVWYSQITICLPSKYTNASKISSAKPFYQQLCSIAQAPRLWPGIFELIKPH